MTHALPQPPTRGGKRSGWSGVLLRGALVGAACGQMAAGADLVPAAVPSWPQFRGPNATGRAAPEAHPPVEFGPEKNLAWKTPIPAGASSPVIWDGRIFMTGFSEGRLEVLCLDRHDGAILWRRPAPADAIEPTFAKFSTPAAPSCATDGECVVSYFGSCGLLCNDFSGRELWRAPMPVIRTEDGFGTGNSPIIHDGIVYLLRDETGEWGGLFAFDVRSGKQLWRTSRQEFHVSYGTPVVWDGTLACIGDLRAKGYDLVTGKERWLVRGLSAYPCTTPAAGEDGRLYLSTWSSGSANEPNPDYDELLAKYDTNKDGALSEAELSGTWLKDFFSIMDDNKNGLLDRQEWEDIQSTMRTGRNTVLCLRPGGQGDVTATQVAWQDPRGAGNVPSPLAYGHRLFLVKDGGLATCYDTVAGQPLCDKQRLGAAGDYYASPILAEGRIYVCSARGVVTVLDAAAEKLTVLAVDALKEPIFATPAIVEDAIYIRTDANLWAFRAPSHVP